MTQIGVKPVSDPARALRARGRVLALLNSGRTPWERPALLSLLLLTGLLYCWGLDLNGWANAYYSAAVMSGAQDWTAFFYGSSDPANAITVDKPPLSIWVMALSVRLFGLSSWSILLPQALMGVLTVFLLYVLVRRYAGASTGLLAATFMAVTPVSTVMFRYNNPDPLLVLLMVLIAWTTVKAIDQRRPIWILVAGFLVGAGFLTKQLQIGLIVPALAITYVGFATTHPIRKLLHLLLAAGGAIAIGGSWLLAVQLTDPGIRPYIGGSIRNSALELALGYNGLDRLSGAAANGALPIEGAEERSASGPLRLFEPSFIGQCGWFLPLALAGLVIVASRLPNKLINRKISALSAFAGIWFCTSALVLSSMGGIVHPYYSLTMVPPLSILAAIAVIYFRDNHKSFPKRLLFAAILLQCLVIAIIAAVGSSAELPGLAQGLLYFGIFAISMQIIPQGNDRRKAINTLFLVLSLAVGPVIWCFNTITHPHVGAGVLAGPSIGSIRGDHPSRNQLGIDVPGGFVSLMMGDEALPSVTDKINRITENSEWASAMVGSETAANYQLELGKPVMAIGGFNGTDPFPTLGQFQEYVAKKEVASVVIQNVPISVGPDTEASRIIQWVRSHYEPYITDGAELYDLSSF